MVTGSIAPVLLVGSFINSEEFRLTFGTLSDAAFVRLLYRNILRREPSQEEVEFQSGALAGLSRGQLASNFLNSSEFRIGFGPRLTAFLLYATLLTRDASPSELSSIEARLKGGMSLRPVVDEILSSVEFRSVLQ
jgi:hypothetical protein